MIIRILIHIFEFFVALSALVFMAGVVAVIFSSSSKRWRR